MPLKPDLHDFTAVKPGHRVTFFPKDAIGGARGLRKRIPAKVVTIKNGTAHIKSATKGGASAGQEWFVPVSKIRRNETDSHRDYSAVEKKETRRSVCGGLSKSQCRDLQQCAKNARAAYLMTQNFQGAYTPHVAAAVKRNRERYLLASGFDTSDAGQCAAYPKIVADVVKSGHVPELKGLSYVSAETGPVWIGSELKIGGRKWRIASVDGDDATLTDGNHTFTAPIDRIPVDAGGIPDDNKQSKRRAVIRFRTSHRKHSKRGKKSWCFTRNKRGQFQRMIT